MNRLNFFGKDKQEPKHAEHTELVPFSPLFNLESVFSDFFNEPFGLGLLKTQKAPALEVYEQDNKVIVKAEIPGAEKKNIKILRNGDILTISGEVKKQNEKKERNYYYTESFLSQFHRAIRLPGSLKVEGAKANYADGILTIEFAKDKEVKPKGRGIEIE